MTLLPSPRRARIDRIQELDDRIRKLNLLASVSRSLTGSLDSDEIIESIMSGAVTVIEAADSGLLSLHDEGTNKLVVRASVGFGTTAFELSQAPGEGLSGKAFKTGEPTWHPDAESARAAMANLTRRNRDLFRRASGGLDSPQSALCVPLLMRGKPIGAMVVENLRTPHSFTSWDLEILQALAQHAAIALENSRLFEAERTARVQVERVLGINEALTKLVLEEKGLEEVARRLSELVSKPVRVTDAFLNVTAASGVPVEVKSGGKLSHEDLGLSQASHVPRTQSLGVSLRVECPRLLTLPITGAGDLLGLLIVGPSGEDMTDIDRAAAGHAAAAVGLALLKERAVLEAETRFRGDLLDSLLDGEGHLPSSAAALGLDPTAQYGLVVALARPESVAPETIRSRIARARSIMEDSLRASRGLTDEKGGSLVGIRVLRSPDYREASGEVARWSADLADTLGRECPELQLLVIAGEPCRELGDLKRVYGEVTSIGRMLDRAGAAPGNYLAADLAALHLLMQVPDPEGLVSFAARVLEPIDAYDDAHGTRLLETLKSYLDCDRKLGPAARQLHVHPHTVQYRLQRAGDLLSLDSRRYGWLDVEIAIRVRELLGRDRLAI